MIILFLFISLLSGVGALLLYTSKSETAKEIKDRIEEMSGTYAPGLNLTAILDTMEEKLRFWREQIKQGVDTA